MHVCAGETRRPTVVCRRDGAVLVSSAWLLLLLLLRLMMLMVAVMVAGVSG